MHRRAYIYTHAHRYTCIRRARSQLFLCTNKRYFRTCPGSAEGIPGIPCTIPATDSHDCTTIVKGRGISRRAEDTIITSHCEDQDGEPFGDRGSLLDHMIDKETAQQLIDNASPTLRIMPRSRGLFSAWDPILRTGSYENNTTVFRRNIAINVNRVAGFTGGGQDFFLLLYSRKPQIFFGEKQNYSRVTERVSLCSYRKHHRSSRSKMSTRKSCLGHEMSKFRHWKPSFNPYPSVTGRFPIPDCCRIRYCVYVKEFTISERVLKGLQWNLRVALMFV